MPPTTAAILRASRDDGRRISRRMTGLAEDAAATGQAGNGGLMRTSVVSLCALDSAARNGGPASTEPRPSRPRPSTRTATRSAPSKRRGRPSRQPGTSMARRARSRRSNRRYPSATTPSPPSPVACSVPATAHRPYRASGCATSTASPACAPPTSNPWPSRSRESLRTEPSRGCTWPGGHLARASSSSVWALSPSGHAQQPPKPAFWAPTEEDLSRLGPVPTS